MAGKSDGQSRIESVVDGSSGQPAASKRVIHLYFADENGRYLKAHQRVIRQPEDDTALVRHLVDALIRGPGNGTGRTLPENARLNSVFVLNDGRVVLDFSADAFKD
ncbi:MAG: GerMN domain-containing protein, partial [Desulfosarcinaceae bacterium]